MITTLQHTGNTLKTINCFEASMLGQKTCKTFRIFKEGLEWKDSGQ